MVVVEARSHSEREIGMEKYFVSGVNERKKLSAEGLESTF
jgi:hypothetical protein